MTLTAKEKQLAAKELAALDEYFTHPNKWCKRYYQRHNRYCLVGAIRKLNLHDSCEHTLRDLVNLEGFLTVTQFNDAAKTTFKDIKGLIKKARKKVQAAPGKKGK